MIFYHPLLRYSGGDDRGGDDRTSGDGAKALFLKILKSQLTPEFPISLGCRADVSGILAEEETTEEVFVFQILKVGLLLN